MINIIRLLHGPPLPFQELRDQTLRNNFSDGDEVAIHKFYFSSYDPFTLPWDLWKKISELNAVAVEVDTRERVPIMLVGCGAITGVVRVVVLYPYFVGPDGKRYPVFDLDSLTLARISDEATFAGYCELSDVFPMMLPRPDIVV